jgi:hypothetical protein
VKNLCENSKLDFADVQHWYDGYIVGDGIHIYSPKSVIDAVARNRLGSYWTQTETYESLKLYIDMDFDGLKESIVQMLGGAHCPIRTISFQNDMTNINGKDDVLTLLIHLGYLAYDADKNAVYIPNEEIRQEFIAAVEDGSHKEVANLIRNSDILLEATLDMDGEAVAEVIEKAHSEACPSQYYNNEQSLRSVIRFAYISCIDRFIQIQELPSGRGFADVVYLPKKDSGLPIMLIELKWNKTAEGAIAQIKEKKYPQALEGFGSDILLVGINYDEKSKKHSCRIERVNRSSK